MAFDENSGSGVQHIAELGFSLDAAVRDLEELERIVQEKSISLGQLAKFDFNFEEALKSVGAKVPATFRTIEVEANKVKESVGMSRNKAKEILGGYEDLGLRLTEYFKQNGKKAAIEWTDEFSRAFPRGDSDFRKLLSPYIKWTENGSGNYADNLTNEIQGLFPELGQNNNYIDMWDKIGDAVRRYRVDLEELTKTGVNRYFENLQQDASASSESIERMIETLERTSRFDTGIGKQLFSIEEIKEMTANIEQAANAQSKITTKIDESGNVTQVAVKYVDELNRSWEETYKWVSKVDDESGETQEGFSRIKAVAIENADAVRKLSDEFNKIQLSTEKMNMNSITIFENSGDTGQADKLRAINAQMMEIKQNADNITRSDLERAKSLQYQSQLISVAAKEIKLQQQATDRASKAQKEAAAEQSKLQQNLISQYTRVAALQKDIRTNTLDVGGASEQLALIRQQSEQLYKKLQIGESITEQEKQQISNNQNLLGQLQAQVAVAKSDASVLSSRNTFSDIAKSIGIYGGGYAIFHELKKGAAETVETMRDVETSMMEIARVMDLTTTQSDSLRDSLFSTANSMAQTFDDTANISQRFAQAGYHETAENIEMTRTALLAMNTAELNAVNSTDSMVGILKQWRLEGSDLITVIDKLNYTADSNATSTQDLVDGLLRSSSAAKNAKLSFDETVGALVTLKEASGRSGREIGTALNSIIAFTTRDSSLKVFEGMGVEVWADEQKTSLNSIMNIWRDLSALYTAEGDKIINTLASQTEMTELFSEEVAAATDSMDEYNQMMNAQAQAENALTDAESKKLTEQFGVYRRNYVIALLENFEKISEVANDMSNAIGHSERENARYMETLDAKTKQLVTSLQELAVQFGESGALDVAKDLTDLASAIAKLTKNTGGLVPVIVLATKAIATLKINAADDLLAKNPDAKISLLSKAMIALRNAATGAGGGLAGMAAGAKAAGAAINTALGPIGWAVIAIQALIGAYNLYNISVQKSIEKSNELTRTFRESQETGKQNISTFEELKSEFDRLSSGVDELGRNVSLSNDEYKKYQNIVSQIVGIHPELITAYDNEGNALANKNQLIERAIELQEALNQAEINSYLIKGPELFEGKVKESDTARKAIAQNKSEIIKMMMDGNPFNQSEINSIFNDLGINISGFSDIDKLVEKQEQIVSAAKNRLNIEDETANKIRDSIKSIAQQKNELDQLSSPLENYLKLWMQFSGGELFNNIDGSYKNALNDAIGELGLTGMSADVAQRHVTELANVFVSLADVVPSSKLKELQDNLSDGKVSLGEYSQQVDGLEQRMLAAGDGSEQWAAAVDVVISSLNNFTDANNSVTASLEQSTTAFEENISTASEKIQEINSNIDNLQSSYKTLASAIDEYNASGTMSIDTLQAVLSLSPEYLTALDLENGKLTINKGKIDELISSLKEQADKKLQNAAAADIAAYADGRLADMSTIAQEAVARLGNNALIAGSQFAEGAKGLDIFKNKVNEILNLSGVDTSKITAETDAIIDAYKKISTQTNNIKIDFGGSSIYGGGGSGGSSGQSNAINNQIKDIQKLQKEQQKAFDNTKKGLQEELKEFEKTHKKEIELLKERSKAIQDGHKAALEGIKEQQKAAQESFKAQEDAVKKRYDAEIQALRDIKQESSREDAREDYNKSRSELLAERSDMEKRTSREAVERIKEIDKAIADLDEKEERRLRDNAIDDQISDIEAKRDAELEAIQSAADAEDERYENRIKNIEAQMEADKASYDQQIKIKEDLVTAEKERVEEEIAGLQKAWDAQKEAFEKQIEALREQVENSRNAAGGQIADMNSVALSASQAAQQIELDFQQAYFRVMQYSDEAARKQLIDLQDVYMKARSVKDLMLSIGEGPINMETFLNSTAKRPTSATDQWRIRSSHTGSLITGDGIVNLQAGELVIRKDISDNLIRSAQMMEAAPKIIEHILSNITNNSTTNNSNTRNANVRVDMRGSQFGNNAQPASIEKNVLEVLQRAVSDFPR